MRSLPCPLLLLAILVSLPASAARTLSAADGRLAAWLGGEVVVFEQPGEVLGRRAAAGLRSLALAPDRPEVALLREEAGVDVLEIWEVETGQLRAIAAEVAPGAIDVIWASGGHALLVAMPGAVAVIDAASLTRRRSVAVPGLAGPAELAISGRDWYLAAAGADGVWLGQSDATELTRLPLAPTGLPTLAFSPDGATLLIAGGAMTALVEVVSSLVQRTSLPDIQPSPAAAFSSDGSLLFLAAGPLVRAIRAGDGRVRVAGLAPAAVTELAVLAKWGHLALRTSPDQIYWYDPIGAQIAAGYPTGAAMPRPAAAPQLPPLRPPSAGPAGPAAYRQVRELLAAGTTFQQTAEPLEIFVLDADYERLTAVESAAGEVGWRELVLSLLGARRNDPELIDESLQPLAETLRSVDLVQFRNVAPTAALTPAALAASYGGSAPTGTDRMTADGGIYPVHRFGPWLLPVSGDAFAPGATLELTAASLEACLGP